MRTSSAIRASVTGVIVLLAALSAWWAWSHYTTSPWTRDGRVRAEIVRVSPDVSGLVTRVAVADNQRVEAGDLLFVVDRERYQQAVEKAEADLAFASAEAQAAIASASMSQASIRASTSTYHMQRERAERRKRLTDVVSQEVVMDSKAVAAAALADLGKAQAEGELAAANIKKAQAGIQQAQALLAQAKLNYRRSEVRAAAGGTITNLDVRTGDYVTTGVPSLALLEDDKLWVYGYFEETKIPAIHIGDSADIKLMAGGIVLKGHVEGVALGIADTAAGIGGNMLADVTPTFSWVRLAQRIPVRVKIDPSTIPEHVTVVAGMSVTVTIHSTST